MKQYMKQYKRLTNQEWSEDIDLTQEFGYSHIYKRLHELENAIEGDTLAFLPCKVGDTVWFVNKYRIRKPIEAYVVDAMTIRQSGKISIAAHQAEAPYAVGLILDEYFGRNVFTTKEAAEKALEELGK